MFLGHVELDFHPFGLPHACGGVSMLTKDGMVIFESSLRMWGCFLAGKLVDPRRMVFPTHVGVFLSV